MVNFAIFNELSLPFQDEIDIQKKFLLFFELLDELNLKNINKLRMDENFKNYSILIDVSLQEFFGKIKDDTFKDRLRYFLTSNIIKIESPLIQDDESKQKELINESQYYYNEEDNKSGLAIADIWNTVSVGFDSSIEWYEPFINLKKEKIRLDTAIEINDIKIRHISKKKHLYTHTSFFNNLEIERNLNINQENFWERKNEFFPIKIIFCKEIEKQIQKLDKNTFRQAIGILREIECARKLITDYNYSSEKETVKTNPKMKAERTFTINDKNVLFLNHIKSLPNANRIYFLEKSDKIYIGYIGKHLSNKSDK